MRIVDALDHACDRTTDGVEFGQTGGIGAFVALQPQFVALLRVEPFEQGLETGLRGESVFIGIKAIKGFAKVPAPLREISHRALSVKIGRASCRERGCQYV